MLVSLHTVRDVLRIDHLLHTACYSKLVFVKYHHALEAGKEGKADGDDDDSDEPVDVSDQVSPPMGSRLCSVLYYVTYASTREYVSCECVGAQAMPTDPVTVTCHCDGIRPTPSRRRMRCSTCSSTRSARSARRMRPAGTHTRLSTRRRYAKPSLRLRHSCAADGTALQRDTKAARPRSAEVQLQALRYASPPLVASGALRMEHCGGNYF